MSLLKKITDPQVHLPPSANFRAEVAAQPEILGVGTIPDDVDAPQNPYVRVIQGVEIDIYRILKAWEITDPGEQHAIKKLLRRGRSGKSALQDKLEAIQSLQRSVLIDEEDA